ncbi:HYR domain-containing protein [Paenibacillus sp. sgz5001063]|uniref:HYR domain-containing protein n=1 Tax=Paenibacillus sp. sgz5001063 TaxID=3242474 RepID=UPI0036D3FBB1
MKQSKRRVKHVQYRKLGIITKWLCLTLLILMLTPGAVFGSEKWLSSHSEDAGAGKAYASPYDAEPPAEQTEDGLTVKDSVYSSVANSVYRLDPSLGVILHHGAYQMSLLAVSNVEGTMSAVSPLLQQMKLSQASGVIPGGRGFMLPQVVAVKDLAGNPLAGVPVTFTASEDSTITAVMRGLNSTGVTVVTDANGYASAANTYTSYVGEGYQVYSKSTGVIRTVEVKATVPGLQPVTFRVEVGSVGSNLIDTTPPTITASALTDAGAPYIAGTWTNHSVTVHYTANDTLSPIKSLTPDQNFTAEGAGQMATGKAVDGAASSDEDQSHYSIVTFGPIKIDKTAPVTTVTPAASETGSWSHDKVTLHFSAADPYSGIDSIYYKSGVNDAVKTAGGSADMEISEEGTTTVTYWAVDKTGNVEAAKTVNVKIDKSGPVISSIVSPEANAKGWNSANVTVALTASDANSGVKEIHYVLGAAGEEKVVAGTTTTFAVQTEGITPLTFWAVDQAGNSTPVQKTEVKIDKTIPVITVPSDITIEAKAVRTPVEIGKASVQDISIPDVIVTNDAPADYPIGTTTVKWTAVDPVGNTSSQVQKVTVKDTTKPVLTVQGDIVVEATAVQTPVIVSGASAKDIFPVIVVNDAPKEFPIGTTKVTWTATDANSNVITATQNVIVVDTIKPVLTVPANITKEATGRRTPLSVGTATAEDIFKVNITNNAPVDFPVGTTKVTWKAEDENGNVTTAEQLITITDTTKPVLTLPKDISIEATDTRMKLEVGAAKAADLFDVLLVNDAPEYFTVGVTKVTWTATDENGNVTKAVQNVTVTDTTVPVLTVPKDISAEATGIKTPVTIGAASATDIFKVIITSNAPDSYTVGKTLVTWTATDENGNITKGTQTVIVTDTTKPLVTLPGDKTAEATGERTKVDIGQPIVTEIFPVTVTNNAPADFPLGTTEVIWTVTDEHGNATTGTQKIKVVDTTKPILIVPANITTEATAIRSVVPLGQPTVTDLFKVTVINDAPVDFAVGTTKVTWMATDASGNVAIGTQNVTVTDNTNPELHVPADVRVEATALRSIVQIGTATATDIFPVTVTSNAPADYPVGITEVTWTAKDANGKITTGKQKVTVEDTTLPVLKVPADISKEATAVNTPVNIGQATATDLFPVEIVSNAPASYPLGKTIVTWKATDANGNISSATQTITIVDTTKPSIAAIPDLKVEATSRETQVQLAVPAVTDIFGVASVTSDAPIAFPIGITEVTWTAKDKNGNLSTRIQKVTVVDTTKPVLSVPKDVQAEASALQTPVGIGQATATDVFNVTVTSNAPESFPIGATEVTWTATDEHGNVSTGVQKITVVDTTKPVLSVPEDLSVEATAVKTPVEIGQATGTDIYKVTVTSNAPETYPLGVTEVIWTATDANGNVTTKVQKITVVDTTSPVLSVPANKTVEATAVKTVVETGQATAADIFKYTIVSNAPADYPLGTTEVTWTATDENGNVATKVQKITVVDTSRPVLTVPKDQTVEATAVKTVVETGQATAADIFKYTIVSNAPADYPLGTTEVTWTATDENGNVSTGVQKITVVDTTKPSLTVPEDQTVEATAIRTPVGIGQAAAKDIFPVTVTSDAPADYPLGTTTVTWTAKDKNGNEITGVQKITVVDTTQPVLKFKGSLHLTKEATALATPVELEVPEVLELFPVVLTTDAPGFGSQDPITTGESITAKFPLGTTKVTWTAKDANGNAMIGIVTVTITDTVKPVLKLPADITLEATAVRTPVEIGLATATDIYDVTVTSNAPADYPLGTTEVTWTAKDANGNVTTGIQKITVVDTTKPDLILPVDKTVEATALKTPVDIGQAKGTDIYKVTVISDAPADYALGVTEVKWTATDENGNITTGVQKITVVDTTKPALKLPADKTVEATALKTPVEIGLATGTDIYKVTVISDAPADYALGVTEVKWTATDENGNVTTGVQKITVVDTTKPALKLPADKTVEATALKTPVEIGLATGTDIYKVTVISDAPADYALGVTEVKWTATDENGNVTTGVQKITVVDTTKPALKLPADKTVEATALKTPVEIGLATGTDIYKVTVISDAPADYALGVTEVKWTATDENGNVTTGVQKITVVDTTKPALKLPADKTVEATALKTPVEIGLATGTDIYKVTVISDAPADYALGVTEVKWTATDENGNVTTGVQKITVVDTTKPALKLPADKTVEATALKTPVEIGLATGKDIYKVTVISDAPADYALGITEVKWTATDENGNVSTGVQKITVVDTTKPALKLPADKTVEATALKTPVEIGLATGKDIYKVTVISDAPADYALGITEVKWTATDENGNVTTGVQKITVVDTTKPALKLPADKTVEATALKTPVEIGLATGKDIYKVTVISDAPADYALGITEVKWTATDENGNVTTGVQKITVVDTTKPALKLPADKTVEATALKTPVEIGLATGTDIYKVTVSSNAPADYALGVTEVKWTATDENGNVTTGVQKITVVDTTKPALKLPADKTVEATALKTPVEIGLATGTDIYKVTVSSNAPADYPLGVTEVKWTATDENGNVTTGVQKITVVDTTKPVLKVPADVTIMAKGVKTQVTLGQATVNDIFGYTLKNDAPADGFPIGKTTVTWTATDANGNVSTAVQYVTVTQIFKVQSYNGTRTSLTNTIAPRIIFENTSSSTIQLSNIKLRYYYTIDGEKTQGYYTDYARVSSSSSNIQSYVTGSFQKAASKTGSDYYLEISFSSGAGSLKPGEEVEIQCRFWKSNFSNYTQTNDYSFNTSATDYTDTNKITVYSSGNLIAGMEP